MNKTINQINKESKLKNLANLQVSIGDGSFKNLETPNTEWGGAYVIVTSSPEKVFNPETDEDDWYGHNSATTYVLTNHSILVSKLFYYVKENLMDGKDNYLYGFMALLANDFIMEFGDPESPEPLLNYICLGVSFYLNHFGWENGMVKSEKAFKMMKFFLSVKTSDEAIKKIL